LLLSSVIKDNLIASLLALDCSLLVVGCRFASTLTSTSFSFSGSYYLGGSAITYGSSTNFGFSGSGILISGTGTGTSTFFGSSFGSSFLGGDGALVSLG
jgi:hypothetical protein